jgi:hypothetical protein
LGPIQLITAYDWVLRCPLPPGTAIVCYSDDTLVLAGGRWFNENLQLSEVAVACVVRAILELGLSASAAKSGSMWFFCAPMSHVRKYHGKRVLSTQRKKQSANARTRRPIRTHGRKKPYAETDEIYRTTTSTSFKAGMPLSLAGMLLFVSSSTSLDFVSAMIL